MKYLLFALLFSSTAFSQQKGDTITIGKGSKADNGYAYISTEPVKIGRSYSMPNPLIPGWEGYKMIIISERIIGQKKYVVLSVDTKKRSVKYLCDLELAKKYGEIKMNL